MHGCDTMKKFLSLLVALILALQFPVISAWAEEAPADTLGISAPSAILMEAIHRYGGAGEKLP